MLTDSKFNMWRAVFAIAHADHEVTSDEKEMMLNTLEKLILSNEQRAVLKEDIYIPGNPIDLFEKITELDDRIEFFKYSKQMMWADDQYSSKEQNVMIKLKTIHQQKLDLEDMVGRVPLQLEEEKKAVKYEPPSTKKTEKGWRGILRELKEVFFED